VSDLTLSSRLNSSCSTLPEAERMSRLHGGKSRSGVDATIFDQAPAAAGGIPMWAAAEWLNAFGESIIQSHDHAKEP
jgi:hypothetical protein